MSMKREETMRNIIELLEKWGLIRKEIPNLEENRVSVPTYDQKAH